MAKLIKVMIKLLIEGKSQLLAFEDFMSRYNKLEVEKIEERLKALEKAGMIQFQREEYGFRILVYDMKDLSVIELKCDY